MHTANKGKTGFESKYIYPSGSIAHHSIRCCWGKQAIWHNLAPCLEGFLTIWAWSDLLAEKQGKIFRKDRQVKTYLTKSLGLRFELWQPNQHATQICQLVRIKIARKFMSVFPKYCSHKSVTSNIDPLKDNHRSLKGTSLTASPWVAEATDFT